MREDVDVMHEKDVDAVDAEAFQRGLEGAHDAVIAVVVDLAARRRVEEFADAGALVRRAGAHDAAGLAREHIVVALFRPRRNGLSRVSDRPSP